MIDRCCAVWVLGQKTGVIAMQTRAISIQGISVLGHESKISKLIFKRSDISKKTIHKKCIKHPNVFLEYLSLEST